MMIKKQKLLILFLSFLLIICLVGCSTKRTALTNDEFKIRAVDYGYTVVDNTNNYSNSSAEIIGTSQLLLNDIEIQFYELSNDDVAKNMFNISRTSFEASKEATNSEYSASVGNYQEYQVTTESRFMRVTRIGNTIMRVNTKVTNEELTIEVFEKMNYCFTK